jgi:tripartite-type tricarboxylate transporter receptor subunit TctC
MRMHRIGILAVAVVSGLWMAGFAQCQEYPAKPIRIVTATPGGANDFMARLIAQQAAPSLRQQIVIDNRPGNLIGEAVAKAPPDGYTLLIAGPTFTIGPLLEPQNYDPVKDFAPVSLAGTTPNIVAVHPSLPVKSIKDLIALARARPGQLNYASTGTGGAAHHFTELLKSMAQVDITRINYKGSGQAVTALLAGEIHMTIATFGQVAPHLKSGRIKALAVTSAQRSSLLPDLPTVADTGVPGYEALQMISICAPAKTPMPIVRRLNQEIVRVITTADAKQKLEGFGVEVIASSPEQLDAAIKSDMSKWGKLIKEGGIHGE